MRERFDHWLMPTMWYEASSTSIPSLASAKVACGRPWSMLTEIDGFWTPGASKCPDCRATAAYMDTVTTIELAFDGNENAWWKHMCIKAYHGTP